MIKQKDPHQILAELERLDDIGKLTFQSYLYLFNLSEFDVNGPSLNEKVLADKRKKLNDTWDRLMKSYVSLQKSGPCIS